MTETEKKEGSSKIDEKDGKENSSIFKLNGWKTTLLIVVVSLFIGFEIKYFAHAHGGKI